MVKILSLFHEEHINLWYFIIWICNKINMYIIYIIWDMYVFVYIYIHTYNHEKLEHLSHIFLMVIGTRRFFRIQDSSKAWAMGINGCLFWLPSIRATRQCSVSQFLSVSSILFQLVFYLLLPGSQTGTLVQKKPRR